MGARKNVQCPVVLSKKKLMTLIRLSCDWVSLESSVCRGEAQGNIIQIWANTRHNGYTLPWLDAGERIGWKTSKKNTWMPAHLSLTTSKSSFAPQPSLRSVTSTCSHYKKKRKIFSTRQTKIHPISLLWANHITPQTCFAGGRSFLLCSNFCRLLMSSNTYELVPFGFRGEGEGTCSFSFSFSLTMSTTAMPKGFL